MASPASGKNDSLPTPVKESSLHTAQKSGENAFSFFDKVNDDVVRFFDKVGDDTLHVILSLLPAKSFAAAACVCRSWSRTASVILSKPKLVSGMSTLPTLQVILMNNGVALVNNRDAVDEVVDKALLENIRPGFVIACFTREFNDSIVHDIVRRRFGSNVPIVTNFVEGVIGVNVELGIYQELTAENVESEMIEANNENAEILGFALIVGWIPDMKVRVFSIDELQNKKEVLVQQRSKLCNEIKEFSEGASGDNSPSAIILFGANHSEKRLNLLQHIDQTFSSETVVAGHFNGLTLYQTPKIEPQFAEIVALVFTRDMNKGDGIGETRFHVPLRRCVSQIGPVYTVESINVMGNISLMTAKNEDGNIVKGEEMIHLLGTDSVFKNSYIGVEKKTKDESRDNDGSMALSLHQVEMDSSEELTVVGNGIYENDSFRFYYADVPRGIAGCGIVPGEKGSIVVGGLVFVVQSYAMKQRYLYRNDWHSEPLLEALPPGTNVSGMYTRKIVRRGPIDLAYDQNGNPCRPLKSYSGRKGIDYLLITHAPAL